jgi:uncharacterized membrane protein
MAEEIPVRLPLSFGFLFYGAAGILLGLVGFAWKDFATDWQHVGEGIPFHGTLAIGTAAFELIGGAALFWRATARRGAGIVTLVYLIFALLWAREILSTPLVWGSWGNLFEELSIVIAGAAIYAALSPPGSTWHRRTAGLSRLYGICPISFGLTHFIYLSGAATWVPKWIPFGGVFWTAATGTFFLLAAFAILTGFLAGLASRLNAIMIVGFELLVWVPKVAAAPHDHFSWSGNAICIALAGGAWAVADLHNQRRKPDFIPSKKAE